MHLKPQTECLYHKYVTYCTENWISRKVLNDCLVTIEQ